MDAPGPPPPWLRWVLTGFVTAVTLAALASATEGPEDIQPGWLGWLLAPALGLVLLVLGRSRPMVTLVLSVALVFAYYGSGRAPIGLELPLAAALVNAAERGRLRSAAVVAATALTAAYTVRITLIGQGLRIFGVQFITSLVVLIGALACGEAIRIRNAWTSELRRRHEWELAAREAELRAGVEAQRQGLARDIHDVLAHTLVVVGQQAAIAEATVESQPAQARQALEVVTQTVQAANAQVRDAVRLLRPDQGEARSPTAGLADLDALVTRLGDRVEVVLQRSALPPLGTAADATAYRIVQEALTNVHRHSGADRVTVRISAEADWLTVSVADTGRPELPLCPGNGMRGMAERAGLVGGTLEVAACDAGVTVTARLPIGAGR